MIKALIPLALAMLTLNGCSDGQSADTAMNAQVDKETVKLLAMAAAADDSSSRTHTGEPRMAGQVDGIRPDVASYIQKTYDIPQLQPHILSMARALEMMLRVDLTDKQAVRNVAREHSLALGCVYKMAGPNPPPPHPALIAQTVADATYNTRARRRGEIEFSKAMSGMAIPALDSECQTD
ncbi:hypothetical protein [Comamonas testosteroni]|uniref:hypothetical protein n=1 Tax=Comamonas testosteroni TaxID=285 RepID=UPI0005B46BBD|nr:hypothetical protein [Comamonas testosteroni]